MKQSLASLVSPLMILPLLGGLSTEALAQDAGSALATRDSSLRASTCVSIWSIRPNVDGSQPNRVLRYGLTYADLDRLLATVPTIERALPIRAIPRQIRHRDRSVNGYVIGTTHEYAAFARLAIDRGRFLTAADNAKYANYAVIAAGAAQALFPEEDPIGKTVKCGTDYYTVVGVTKWIAGRAGDRDPPAMQASDTDVYIPVNTCRLRMGERVVIERGDGREFEECQLSQIVVQVRDGSRPEDAAALIRAAIMPFHPKDDVGIAIGGMTRERPTANLADESEPEKYLPGSRMTLQKAAQSSQIVAVVKVIEVGKPSPPTQSGQQRYRGYQLKLVKLLKGDAPKETFSTYLTLRYWPRDTAETLPAEDREYLFFLEARPDPPLYAIKVLRPTDENIRITFEALREEGQ